MSVYKLKAVSLIFVCICIASEIVNLYNLCILSECYEPLSWSAIVTVPYMPEQALGGIPLDFGIVMEDKPSELSCIILLYHTHV